MPNTIVIGAQWGDEGKGKIIDTLSERYNVIIRYQGGCNAGHTVIIGDKKYILHSIPSGILRQGVLNIIGNNVVIDPLKFLKEINDLRNVGLEVSPENLRISDKCHLTLSYLNKLDEATGKKVETTGRGIGPTYTDKTKRIGIRTFDLLDLKRLEGKVRENTESTNYMLKYCNATVLNVDEVMEGLSEASEGIIPFIHPNIGSLILGYDGSLLYEGAQGTLLDIDHGTYPYVTSSNPTIGGAFTGTGVYVNLENRIGILKAYTTRVGNGPFPTEQDNEIGERLRKMGGEFGATTGRPRRCGWLDLFIAKYSIIINGFNQIALTKLDVLDQEDTIKLCIKYELNGREVRFEDFTINRIEEYTPVYKELPGWKKNISEARKIGYLPENARKYIGFIEDYLGSKLQ